MIATRISPRRSGRGGWPGAGWIRVALGASLSTLAVGALLWACSGGGAAPPPSGSTSPTPTASAPGTLDCSQGGSGCPCAQPGQVQGCGHVAYRSKDYVSCSIGTRTCLGDGTWGPCTGQQVVTLNSWQAAASHLLNQPSGVSANSVCDPSLYQVDTVLTDSDAGYADASITVLEGGGITLAQYGSATGTGCAPDASALQVTPSTASLRITQVAAPPTPNTAQFSATLGACAGDGGVSAIWTVDQPGVAVVSSTGQVMLEFPYAGPIHVTAYAGKQSATATLNVTVNALDTSKVDAGSLAPSFATTCGVDAGGGG